MGVVELGSCDSKCGEDKEGRVRRYVQKRRFIEWEMEPCLPIFSAIEVDYTTISSLIIRV